MLRIHPKKTFVQRFFRGDDHAHGSSLVEFALTAPIFFLLMASILEFGVVMVIRNFLQIGVTAGARAVQLGQSSAAVTTVVQNACMGGVMTSSSVSVTIQSFANCAAIGTSPTAIGSENTGASGTGSSGQMVLVRGKYIYTPIIPTVSAILGSTYTIYATSIIRND